MKRTIDETRRLYGPNFDPNLVVTAALRAMHHDYTPLITVYGTDEDQRYAAIESLGSQVQVLDINHPETSKHIRLSRSTGEPVVVGINPNEVPFTFTPLDDDDDDSYVYDKGTPEWVQDLYDLIYDTVDDDYSVTVDLDSEVVKGIESIQWDFGYKMFPAHPIKRAQAMSLKALGERKAHADKEIEVLQSWIAQGHRTNREIHESRKDYIETLLGDFGWSSVADALEEVEQGRELPRFLDWLIRSHAESSAALEFLSSQDIGAA